jgi:hypothetical protein
MWKKYAKRFIELMGESFFVGFDKIGLTDEEKKELQASLEKESAGQDKNHLESLELHLVKKIADEILKDMTDKWKIVSEYAKEKRDEFFRNEFGRLPSHERLFIIICICRCIAINEDSVICINDFLVAEYCLDS